MKHKWIKVKLVTMAAVALVLHTSCSAGDDAVIVTGETPTTPIIFCVSAASGELPPPLVTTRGHSTNENYNGGYTFKAGDIVTIGMKGSGVPRSATEERKQYTVAGGAGTNALTYTKDEGGATTSGFSWYGTSETISEIRAWSYAGDNAATPASDPVGQSFSIDQDLSGTETKELLYGTKSNYAYSTYDTTDGKLLNIQMQHQLARVVITITEEVTSSMTINSVKIGNGTDAVIPTSATFDPSQADHWSSIGTEKGEIKTKEEASGIYSAVLFPTTYTAGTKFIHVNTNKGNFVYTIPTGGHTFNTGCQYNFTIKDLNEIKPKITVTPWDTTTGTQQALTF